MMAGCVQNILKRSLTHMSANTDVQEILTGRFEKKKKMRAHLDCQ